MSHPESKCYVASDQVVPCDIIAKRAMGQDLSAGKAAESGGFHQFGGMMSWIEVEWIMGLCLVMKILCSC